MKKKWIGINLLLLVGVAMAAWKLNDSVHQYRAQNDLSAIKPAEARDVESILPPQPVFQTSNPATFADIVDKNVFSESRTKGETPAPDSPNGNMPTTQKPTLVGVVIAGANQRVASLRAPTSGRNRNTADIQLKRVDDTYEGYRVTDIEPDHIVLDNGSQKQILYLNDTSQPAQRRQTAVVSTRVIPIGGGTATAAATPIVNTSGLSQIQQLLQNRLMRQIPNASTTGTPGQAGNISALISPVLPNSNSSQSGTTQTQQPAVIIQSSQPTGTSNTGTQGRTRVIRSPFGDIIRNAPNQ